MGRGEAEVTDVTVFEAESRGGSFIRIVFRAHTPETEMKQ